jgi:hypothetical protein
MVYQELAAALIEQRRPTEAADILWEGLSKYPKEAPALWDTLAVLCHAEGAWPQAAVASRCSLLTFAERPERMNAIYRESRERMKPEELKKLIEVEPGIEPALQRAQATASKARAEGRPFLIAETAELVRSFSGVQRLDVAATSRPVAARAPLFSWDSPAAPAPEPAAAAAASGPGDPEDAVFIRSRTAVAGEHYLSGRKDKAKAILEDLVRTFPGHPETRTAKDLLAKMKP